MKRCETARFVPYLPQVATDDVRVGNPSVRLKPEVTSGQSRPLLLIVSTLTNPLTEERKPEKTG
jgi:hypothetical protein